jgi:hypothetical protein
MRASAVVLDGEKMRKLSRTIPIATLVSVAVMASASQAGATVTIGQTFPGAFNCSGPSTYFVESTAPASPSYAVPAGGGVITSWSLQAGADTGLVKLAVLRNAGGPSTFTTIGASAAQTLTANSLNSFPTSLAVQANDRIAALILSGSYDCASFGFDLADIGQRDADAVHDIGSTFTYTDPSDATRINIAATVEPTQSQPAKKKKKCKKKKHKRSAETAKKKKCKKKKKK